MKYALIADLHGNLEALYAILAHAGAQGVGRYVFLGDIVGYGPDPEPVLELCRHMVSTGDALAVLGNHDAAACGRDSTSNMNEAARAVIEWTRSKLKPRHQQWLASLPLVLQRDRMTWVHASALRPEAWTYIDTSRQARLSLREAGSTWVFSGHVHDPMLYYTCPDQRVPGVRLVERRSILLNPRRSWLAIVGSAGQPRDGLPGARYAVFDRSRYLYTSYRLAYDFAATAAKIRAAGLPERLAHHIEGVLLPVPRAIRR
ncbi:metallophosphoesterase family protein [Uliginosibacterium sp. 31-16]|uniref:metallophosphoesterase family protein n=1 Tax=Uliginosibacterium sp. 31-16 TaxID=3068315 RepID=UPI00273F316D|nr:metallophosphoesterase [Uliginosibacterium sp. 31-16]MDP5238598.1 metallophosphoesterase family protein [Uliginosibacterium sp. 31-16]